MCKGELMVSSTNGFSQKVASDNLKTGEVIPFKKRSVIDALPSCQPILVPKIAATHVSRPLYGSRVQGGFPSPADDYLEGELDLNQHLIKNKEATFYVRATGDT